MPENTFDTVSLVVNGKRVIVTAGTVVAAAILQAGISSFRASVTGEPRAPLCGMGVCFECRVTIDGIPHCKSCEVVCRNGMRVETN